MNFLNLEKKDLDHLKLSNFNSVSERMLYVSMFFSEERASSSMNEESMETPELCTEVAEFECGHLDLRLKAGKLSGLTL
jgi:hypothetical protein